jgi:hypothetical protein
MLTAILALIIIGVQSAALVSAYRDGGIRLGFLFTYDRASNPAGFWLSICLSVLTIAVMVVVVLGSLPFKP